MTTNNTNSGCGFDWAGTTVDFGSRAPILAFMALFKTIKLKLRLKKRVRQWV